VERESHVQKRADEGAGGGFMPKERGEMEVGGGLARMSRKRRGVRRCGAWGRGSAGDQNPTASVAGGTPREQGKELSADRQALVEKNEINSKFEIDNSN
jgi:hypothetical protein